MNNKTLNSKVYSVVFVTLFFLILLAQLFVPDFNINTVSGNYLWRKDFISGYNTFKYKIGDRLFPIAVVGKDGWVYFTGETSISDYQKVTPINVGKMKRLTGLLRQLKEKIDEYEGTFLLVIPPNKSTVYPQNMPDEISVIGEISSLDRFLEYLRKNSNIQVLDLRPIFNEVKDRSTIYYKTDTHWNCLGAFYAYEAILKALQPLHPNLVPHPISDFEITTSQNATFDIPGLLGINITEPAQNMIPKFQTDFSANDLPSLMILHDSFYAVCLEEIMQTTLKQITSTPYKDAEMTDYLQLIETEKPDIVIVEFVERYIEYFYWHLID